MSAMILLVFYLVESCVTTQIRERGIVDFVEIKKTCTMYCMRKVVWSKKRNGARRRGSFQGLKFHPEKVPAPMGSIPMR